jgi:general secretion pathway protein G
MHGDGPIISMMRTGKKEHGFTLIELMVVIVILGILAAIIAPRLVGRTDDARVTQAKIQIKNFETALKLFKMDNGFYPSTEQGLEALIRKPTIGRIPKNYREGGYLEKKKLTPDPWGNPYIYISPGANGDYDIISYGADGKPGGEGYDADITNWDL